MSTKIYFGSKVHGANMGPIWGRQDLGGPHVGPMNLAIWVFTRSTMSMGLSNGQFYSILMKWSYIIWNDVVYIWLCQMQVCKISPWHKNGAMILNATISSIYLLLFFVNSLLILYVKIKAYDVKPVTYPKTYLLGWCQCRYVILIITQQASLLCRQTISSSIYSILMDDDGWTCGYQICIRRATLNYCWNFKSRSYFFIERDRVEKWVAVYTMACGHIHQ